MLLDIIYVLVGFAMLLWGADRFVAGAAATANRLGVPPVLIGVTIVGFATSAPEIMVAISAASEGLTGMAMGNALGSNIANVGLVLGTAAVIRPICSSLSETMSKELTVLILLTPLTMLLFLDSRIDRLEASILLGTLVIFIAWITILAMRHGAESERIAQEISEEIPHDMSIGLASLWIVVGFGALIIGAQLLVNGAENLAQAFQLSDLVIGLTIVAVGTSLPELAVSVVSAIKGESGIAVGNILGSNVFNLLAVVGIAGWINPTTLETSILSFHYPVMIAFTMPLLLIAYNPFGPNGLSRTMGFILLAGFFTYQIVLLSMSF